MKALAARRRHPLTAVVLLMLALVVTGGLYALLAPQPAEASTTTASADDIAAGEKLFLANCATCHGLNAAGTQAAPSLIGVGAASVDFQVGTGRMPAQANGPQVLVRDVQYTEDEIAQLAAYVASLGAGPAIPTQEQLDASDDITLGGELFRVNCAMCHNVVGAGGALTEGKFAPSLSGVSPEHVYEAMLTGPQSMPVFNDANITPDEKSAIIAYLQNLEESGTAGGLSLGSLGPVSEGLFAWVFGIGALIACAVWLGAKAS